MDTGFARKVRDLLMCNEMPDGVSETSAIEIALPTIRDASIESGGSGNCEIEGDLGLTRRIGRRFITN